MGKGKPIPLSEFMGGGGRNLPTAPDPNRDPNEFRGGRPVRRDGDRGGRGGDRDGGYGDRGGGGGGGDRGGYGDRGGDRDGGRRQGGYEDRGGGGGGGGDEEDRAGGNWRRGPPPSTGGSSRSSGFGGGGGGFSDRGGGDRGGGGGYEPPRAGGDRGGYGGGRGGFSDRSGGDRYESRGERGGGDREETFGSGKLATDRPRLQLTGRTRTDDAAAPEAQAARPARANDPFGGARAVDTATVDKKFETLQVDDKFSHLRSRRTEPRTGAAGGEEGADTATKEKDTNSSADAGEEALAAMEGAQEKPKPSGRWASLASDRDDRFERSDRRRDDRGPPPAVNSRFSRGDDDRRGYGDDGGRSGGGDRGGGYGGRDSGYSGRDGGRGADTYSGRDPAPAEAFARRNPPPAKSPVRTTAAATTQKGSPAGVVANGHADSPAKGGKGKKARTPSPPPKPKEEEPPAPPKIDHAALAAESAVALVSGGLQGDELKEAVEAATPPTSGYALLLEVLRASENAGAGKWVAPAAYGKALSYLAPSGDKKKQAELLYAAQKYAHEKDFPKSTKLNLITDLFQVLYQAEVCEDIGFEEWKDDVDSKVPGKQTAIIQTMKFITWLEEEEEEEEEED